MPVSHGSHPHEGSEAQSVSGVREGRLVESTDVDLMQSSFGSCPSSPQGGKGDRVMGFRVPRSR